MAGLSSCFAAAGMVWPAGGGVASPSGSVSSPPAAASPPAAFGDFLAESLSFFFLLKRPMAESGVFDRELCPLSDTSESTAGRSELLNPNSVMEVLIHVRELDAAAHSPTAKSPRRYPARLSALPCAPKCSDRSPRRPACRPSSVPKSTELESRNGLLKMDSPPPNWDFRLPRTKARIWREPISGTERLFSNPMAQKPGWDCFRHILDLVHLGGTKKHFLNIRRVGKGRVGWRIMRWSESWARARRAPHTRNAAGFLCSPFPLVVGNANNEPNNEMVSTSLTLSCSAEERTADQPGGWI